MFLVCILYILLLDCDFSHALLIKDICHTWFSERLSIYVLYTVLNDCKDIIDESPGSTSGIYDIRLPNSTDTIAVKCDMETDSGGWTVFHRRFDGSVDFYRNWKEFKNGFGNLSGEFWLGNEVIHRLTSYQPYTLRVELEDWENNTVYESYSNFIIDGEDNVYTLHVSGYSGTAGDVLKGHDGCGFSASDFDNDNLQIDCANYYKGGWWYNGCFNTNLNGPYVQSHGKMSRNDAAFSSYIWKSRKYSLKGARMMIRQK
ncbi:hypothetical protein FSP39_010359 [Pinctada imbricata]|uniref:Fibrinogen C-terminal domain-containing protein n=1 Tax=Pinctada imbricata TaxID=66713 RepID=A0AA89BWZ8_PINIB|nr:hypothetical protein FSP39_010359 [Pinctada imbricata]